MKIEFDHVAILVDNIELVLELIRPNKWVVGDVEAFPAEGTKEVYIGPSSASGKLLLIEAIGAGPYKDALEKRGVGLHHIALNVNDMMAFAEHISGSGWYLHPKSLHTFEQHNTLWLARPGAPLLIEVVQRKLVENETLVEFVSCIEVPLPESKPQLVSTLDIVQFQSSPSCDVFMTIDGVRRQLDAIMNGDGR